MMDRESKYFTLSMESLRVVGGWAAECAERALPVYEKHAASDSRPRAAIEGIRQFAGGGGRTARLRTLASEAHAAAREVGDPAAAAAARAAGVAAASAYTHPLADVHQTKHVVGAAAYAALALELDHGGDTSVGDCEVRRAIESAPTEVREVLLEMPARPPGKSRWETLLYELDAGIRARALPHGESCPQIGGTGMAVKTVAEKARVKPDSTIAVINPVHGVVESLGLPPGVRFVEPAEAQLVFLFVHTRAELLQLMPPAVEALARGSAIWVFFRKGATSAHLDMSRNDVWALAEGMDMRPLGLVGIDETWSAFRLRRKER